MFSMAFAMLDTDEERSIFEQLYNSHRQRLYRIAFSKLHNPQNAEDAVSEVFLRILNKSANVFEVSPNKRAAFLNILIRNVCSQMYNRSVKENTISVDDENTAEIADKFDLEDEVIGKIEHDRLVEFISRLPSKTRDALVLRSVMGMSTHETAEQLGITENALRQRIYEARKAIRTFVERESEIHV